VSPRGETWLWLAQRGAAIVLTGAVILHLATIVYATRHGLSAGDILARTKGNRAWLIFYLAFALAASVHGGIGLRTVIREATPWQGATLDLATLLVVVLLTLAGGRAALALFA
jgi:fumarate reductase subunit C